MTDRLHPQDLRAIVAAIMTHDLGIKEAVEGSGCLLAELERTAKPEPVTDLTADHEAEWEEAYYQKLHLDALERAVKNTREVLGAKNHEATEVAAKRALSDAAREERERIIALLDDGGHPRYAVTDIEGEEGNALLGPALRSFLEPRP